MTRDLTEQEPVLDREHVLANGAEQRGPKRRLCGRVDPETDLKRLGREGVRLGFGYGVLLATEGLRHATGHTLPQAIGGAGRDDDADQIIAPRHGRLHRLGCQWLAVGRCGGNVEEMAIGQLAADGVAERIGVFVQ